MRRAVVSPMVFLLTVFAFNFGFCQKPPDTLADKCVFTQTMVEMSWMEIKQTAENGALVLLPVAVVEEHGPHMDLSPDIYITVIYCRLIKKYLEEKGIAAIIAPPFYWGINGTYQFPGSFTVKPETFKAILFDTIESLTRWGFKKIFYVNCHGDGLHRKTLRASADEIRQSQGIDVYDLSALDITIPAPSFPPERTGKFKPDYHAGANETADIFAFFPEKVKTDVVKTLLPQSTFEPLGYVGDPAHFYLEQGGVSFKVEARYEAERIAMFIKDSGK